MTKSAADERISKLARMVGLVVLLTCLALLDFFRINGGYDHTLNVYITIGGLLACWFLRSIVGYMVMTVIAAIIGILLIALRKI